MTVRVVTIVGARPQFIKAAMVIGAIQSEGVGIVHNLIHTGQHYDQEMSDGFFKELDLPEPDVNLGIGGGTHGEMTGRMIIELERILVRFEPDWTLVYGDTDSTLAAALTAAKMHIPVAHVEAGLRSFNRGMPEEINRVLADHVSDLLLCPTRTAVDNLIREGITQQIELVGDVMYDAALHHRRQVSTSRIEEFGVSPFSYFLATCHRAENADNPDRLRSIMTAFSKVASLAPVLLPLHPRTKKRLREFAIEPAQGVILLPPLAYIPMISLESNAIAIMTDSGGVQKEAYFFGTPCITIRAETEWTETLEAGWNTLVDTDATRMFEAASRADDVRKLPRPTFYGEGDAAKRIVALLSQKP